MYVLHGHPLSSYFQKAAIAFYETGTPFRLEMLADLSDPAERARFQALWPIGKMPVLEDTRRGRVVAESSIVIEYIATHEPGAARLLPKDPDEALRVRLMDRIFDLHVQAPMQRYSDYRREVPGARDEAIPEVVKAQLATAYGFIEREIEGRAWAAGETFTMADCAAAPALFYADRIVPLKDNHPKVAAYYERLKARPGYARALEESAPFLQYVPF